MTEAQARAILWAAIAPDESLGGVAHSAPSDVRGPRGYLEWQVGDDMVTIDTALTADELEAIAWWMRNKKPA